jgi:hypothetical protein
MTLQPDDPGRPERISEDALDVPEGAETGHRSDGTVPTARNPETGADDELDLDGLTGPDEKAEPTWVLPVIVLALVALSGTVLLFVMVGLAALALLALGTPPTQPPEQRGDPFRYPMGGPFGGGGLML